MLRALDDLGSLRRCVLSAFVARSSHPAPLRDGLAQHLRSLAITRLTRSPGPLGEIGSLSRQRSLIVHGSLGLYGPRFNRPTRWPRVLEVSGSLAGSVLSTRTGSLVSLVPSPHMARSTTTPTSTLRLARPLCPLIDSGSLPAHAPSYPAGSLALDVPSTETARSTLTYNLPCRLAHVLSLPHPYRLAPLPRSLFSGGSLVQHVASSCSVRSTSRSLSPIGSLLYNGHSMYPARSLGMYPPGARLDLLPRPLGFRVSLFCLGPSLGTARSRHASPLRYRLSSREPLPVELPARRHRDHAGVSAELHHPRQRRGRPKPVHVHHVMQVAEE